MTDQEVFEQMNKLWGAAFPCWLWPNPIDMFIKMHELFDFSDKIGPLQHPEWLS